MDAELDRSSDRSDSDALLTNIRDLYAGLLADEDLDTTLGRVARLAAATLPTCDFADVTLLRDGKPVSKGMTDPVAGWLDAVQYANQAGPCIEAWSHGQVIHVESTRGETRWPEYSALAAELGVMSTLAIPLMVNGTTIGALNLYSRREQVFTELDDELGRLFAEQVAVALANAQNHAAAVTLAQQLQAALETRGPIEQAKGILIARHRCSPQQAFDMLVEWSQHQNRKLRLVADELVAEAQQGG